MLKRQIIVDIQKKDIFKVNIYYYKTQRLKKLRSLR